MVDRRIILSTQTLEVFSAHALVYVRFLYPLSDSRDEQQLFIDQMREAAVSKGAQGVLLFDYTDLEVTHELSRDALMTISAVIGAFAAMGVRRYFRIVPPRLDDFVARFRDYTITAGIETVHFASMEEALSCPDLAPCKDALRGVAAAAR